MTYLVERLAQLREHLRHARELQARVQSAAHLQTDVSLRNDVLFTLLMMAQLLIDIAGELSARAGLRFDDYRGAIRNLTALQGFSEDLVRELVLVPGFRNVLIHEYIAVDPTRVVEALQNLEPMERFVAVVSRMELIS